MRSFVIMCCVVAVAWADQLGYNYRPGGHSNSGLSFTPGSNIISGLASGHLGGIGVGSISGGLGSLGGGSIVGGGSVSGGVSSLSGGLSSLSGGLSSLNGGCVVGDNFVGSNGVSFENPSFNAPVELEKEFYTFSAPEGEFDDGNAAQRIAGSVKKGIRVIFIKGPENNGLENAALSLAKHVAEQKTAIYVLNKQADIGDLAHKLNSISTNINNKPEVHFVKYRTPEDAANAQKAIQSQYDSLGGTSQSHNGGVAPVLNFASQAPARYAPAHTPGNSYLPSSVLRLV